MKISCNRLKKYIKNSELIDWISIWDTFTIKVAEVEKVEVKGLDIDNIVVAEVLECETHPKKEKYHICKVNNGLKELSILCGAPNVRKGIKAPLVNVGGKVQGFEITEKEIAGVLSQGMLLAMDELGIGEDHAGIIELPSDAIVGTNLKDIFPIDDVIVEIDNKSLTNRPDLWGHYGIAREIAAITNTELLPLETMEIINEEPKLDISIETDNCLRYMGLKVNNILNNETPMDIKIFLHYIGMRSLSLVVDLTNYLMLELGTPMHAFDASKVSSIQIGNAKDQEDFITLDGTQRTLNKDIMMIKNNNEYYAIAGIMGGLNSEIESNTNSIIIESACFDATNIRKSATYLGLRTEASSRYEKSLDPNMFELAIKRYAKLLNDYCPDIKIASKLTDVYPKKLTSPTVKLRKEKLNTYLGFVLSSNQVIKILESLEFIVNEKKDYYEVCVPTFRATKDISIEEDLIEEISRIYGYENIEAKPLRVELNANMDETAFEMTYELKTFLATKYCLNEVHTYLWNNTTLLNKLGEAVDNVKLLGRTEDNVLRNSLVYSLIETAINNAKYKDKLGIFEVGTVIVDNQSRREISIMLMDESKFIEDSYYQLKRILSDIFSTLKNINIDFKYTKLGSMYHDSLSLGIFIDDELYGYLGVIEKNIIKKKCLLYASIDYEKFINLENKTVTYEHVSKYPTVELDYTIVAKKNVAYQIIDDVLRSFKHSILLNYEFLGLYETETDIKYTFRYTVGSYERTLTSEELDEYKKQFITYVRNNELEIME